MQLSIYILLISQILLACCNYTLVPSQVLLPRTSFYRCKKTNQLLSVTVQFILKIEPSLCVNWKLQDSDVLSFDKSNYTALQPSRDLEDSREPESYSSNELKGCSATVVLTTLPLNLKEDTVHDLDLYDSSENVKSKRRIDHLSTDVRTFVFAYDSKFRFHAVTEVVISKLDRLTVETAYRKVSKNQVFSLKLRGFDREGNTFSSLEGNPFYLQFSGPRIFDVLEVKEGELYSEKRSNILSQNGNFTLPEGATLVTDVVLLKGVKVGRSSLSFGLFLDEYSEVVSAPVEFVVNDFVVLSHQNVYMINNTCFKLELRYPVNYLFQNGKDEKVDMSNYEWCTDSDFNKLTITSEGVIEAHVNRDPEIYVGDVNDISELDPLERGYQCVVYARDLRTGEELKSYVIVMKPHSLVLKYSSFHSLNKCLISKNIMSSKDFDKGTSFDNYLVNLTKMVDHEECFAEPEKNTIYLYEGGYYVFKFNLLTYNRNLFNTFDPESTNFSPTDTDKEFEEDELLKLVGSRENYYFYKANNLGCDYYDLVHTNSLNPEDVLSYKYKICVLDQIKLEGYECANKHKLPNNYEYLCCERPLVVSVGDMFEVNPSGGSGKFKYELEGSQSESNKFVCSNKGSYKLKISDLKHEENGLVMQVIATTVASSEFEYATSEDYNEFADTKSKGELTIRLKKTFKLKLNLYANLTGVKPMFKESFNKEDEKFYTFNYFNDGNHLVSLRQKYENLVQLNQLLDNEAHLPEKDVKLLSYDRRVLELKSVSGHESSLVLTFVALASSVTRFGINLNLLRDYYRGHFGDEEPALGELNESNFQSVLINVYRDPELYVKAKYRIPIINLATLTGSASKMAEGETELLANVALGGKVELGYKFGLSHTKPSFTLITSNNVVHMETLDDQGKNRGFMLYCVNLGYEDMAFEFLDYKKSYRVTCDIPMYNRVYPVTKLSSNLYELVYSQGSGVSSVHSDKFAERKYKVNNDILNRYINLMFDSNDNLLLPSDAYQSSFQVLALVSKLTVTATFWDKSINEQFIYKEDTPVFEFLPNEYEGAKRELKIVGSITYANDPSNYSANFNRVRKYRKINQLISSTIKSRWNLVEKHHQLTSYILISPKVNPAFTLSLDDQSCDDLYVMYNKMFVYRVFVSGGSGSYSLVKPTDLIHRFSRVYIFPNDLKNSEKLDDAESLPDLENEKVVLVNLFNYHGLKGAGRFLTFTTNNMSDLSLVLKDDKLLWQKSLELKLHFKYPNRFKLVLEPLTYTNSSLDKGEFEFVEGKEEMLYLNENYKLRLSGYYNDHKLLKNTMLWVFALSNDNVALKSMSVFRDRGYHDHLLVSEDEVLFRGSDDIMMSTFELGTSVLTVSDLDKSMRKVYKFRLVNKLMLDYSEVTVLTNTSFDISFKNMSNYNDLKVALSKADTETTEDHTLEKYGLTFNELGVHRYKVGVMYANNVLTRLEHKLVVNVSKPAKMLFHLSELSAQIPLSSASKMGDLLAVGSLSSDEHLYEYTVDRSTVVNLNVLLFDDNDNLFTPLYLSNSNLEFLYQLTDSCYLLSPGVSANYESVGGLRAVGDGVTSMLDEPSSRVGGSSGTSKSDGVSNKGSSPGEPRNTQFTKELVTNRYNVLLYVDGDCEVVVTTRYLGVLHQSKKLKFRIRPEEKLFGTTDEIGALFSKNREVSGDRKLETGGTHQTGESVSCGVCCGKEEENNLSYGGVYEINKNFKSYPENKLKYLGKRLYRVEKLGNVLIMTDTSTYNVKLLKPTHFSLFPLNKSYHHSADGMSHSTGLEVKSRKVDMDFVTNNMNKLVFKLVLNSNGNRLKMPKNAHFRVIVKDLSVFTYELEDDRLTLIPHKYGRTSLELIYSLAKHEHANVDYDDQEEGEEVDAYHNEINRYYSIESTYHDVTSVLNVMTGSRVYLTGSRVNGLVVNLDVNSYEFAKFLKNKFTVKSFGACFNEKCGMVYMNKTEYVGTVRKLKNVLNLNRASYKLLLNVVTNSLNTLLSVGDEAEYARESRSLLSMNQLVDTPRCSAGYCWLELKYELSPSIGADTLNNINNQLHCGDERYKVNDEVEEVLRMLSSPLLGVDSCMWNSSTGMAEEGIVEPSKPSKHKFKNLHNEELVLNVTHFNASHYKFKQVDNYTLLLLPHISNTFKGEESVLGNHANVLYFNYGLNYKFSDPQLNKLYFLKPTYYPYFSNATTGASVPTGFGAASGNITNTNESRDTTCASNHKHSRVGAGGGEEYASSSDTSQLVYRLGYSVLLSNNVHKEWNVFKNQLRTMSADALKGKRKLALELLHYKDSHSGSSDRDAHSGGAVSRDESAKAGARDDGKERVEILMSDEVEVDLPENILFVNSDGLILNELTESNMNNVLHVYPVNSSHKLYLNSNKYVIKTVEKSGQLTTFIVYSNVTYNPVEEKNNVYKNLFEEERYPAGNVYLMVLNSNDSIIGKIKVNVNAPSSTMRVDRLNFWKRRNWSDVLTLVVTLAVGLFLLFVYNSIRNYQYYQPTVPIKLERSLPKVFENLHQTGYHSKYYHNLR